MLLKLVHALYIYSSYQVYGIMELREWDTMETGYDRIGRIRVPSSYKKCTREQKLERES